MREDQRDRDKEDRPPRDRRDRDRRGERMGSARRSVSPRLERPRSHSCTASASDRPNFAPSRLLATKTNTVKNADGKSTLLKYNKSLVRWGSYISVRVILGCEKDSFDVCPVPSC
jgi:smad nuclear-interacting protein 1